MSRRTTPLKCNHLLHCKECRTELEQLEAMYEELLYDPTLDESEHQDHMSVESHTPTKGDTHRIPTDANISLRAASSQLPPPRKA